MMWDTEMGLYLADKMTASMVSNVETSIELLSFWSRQELDC
jgi:hypothetical protein